MTRRTLLLSLLGTLVACSAPVQRPSQEMGDALAGYGLSGQPKPAEVEHLRAPFARLPEGKIDAQVARWTAAVVEPRSTRGVGKPNAGRLITGAELPEKGPGYVTFKPYRSGTWQLIHTTMAGIAEVLQRFPQSAPVVIGDLSRDGGRHLPPHRSHQNGLDVDIGYYLVNNRAARTFIPVASGRGTHSAMDTAKTLALIEAFLRTGWVDMIFIDTRIQEALHETARGRGWSDSLLRRVFQVHCPGGCPSSIIRHSKGHINHLHLRVRCDPASDEC
jgi:murein endopeptidase